MSIEFMDEHADEREVEQQKLDATAVRKKEAGRPSRPKRRSIKQRDFKLRCCCGAGRRNPKYTEDNVELKPLVGAPLAGEEGCEHKTTTKWMSSLQQRQSMMKFPHHLQQDSGQQKVAFIGHQNVDELLASAGIDDIEALVDNAR